MAAISREFFTRSGETPRALYRHTRRGERIVFARCREKGSESACAYCARFCFYLIKKAKARRTDLFNEILFVHFDFYLFNCAQYAYLQVCGSTPQTNAPDQLKLTVRYPGISAKSKGHQNRCPLLLELIFSAGAFGFSACFYSPLRLSICLLFFYPLLCSLIRFAALRRKLTHRVS